MGLQHRSYKKGIQKAYKQKREAHPSLASRFKASWKLPIVSKRATPNFTPICIYQSRYAHYAYGTDTP